jgi:hypothetical protein
MIYLEIYLFRGGYPWERQVPLAILVMEIRASLRYEFAPRDLDQPERTALWMRFE